MSKEQQLMNEVIKSMLDEHQKIIHEAADLLTKYGDNAAYHLEEKHIFCLAVAAGIEIESTTIDGKLKWHTKYPVTVFVNNGQYEVCVNVKDKQ